MGKLVRGPAVWRLTVVAFAMALSGCASGLVLIGATDVATLNEDLSKSVPNQGAVGVSCWCTDDLVITGAFHDAEYGDKSGTVIDIFGFLVLVEYSHSLREFENSEWRLRAGAGWDRLGAMQIWPMELDIGSPSNACRLRIGPELVWGRGRGYRLHLFLDSAFGIGTIDNPNTGGAWEVPSYLSLGLSLYLRWPEGQSGYYYETIRVGPSK